MQDDRLERIKSLFPHVETTKNHEDLLNSDLDAVAIATPVWTHYPLAKSFLEAGKHVFVEKPLTPSSEECQELIELAASKNLVLMVGHTFEYTAAVNKIKEIVKSGELGDILYVNSTRVNLGLFQQDINVIWDLAPHDISMMLALTGRMPERVVCNGEAWLSPSVADMTLSHFDFGEQLQGHIFVSWLHPYKDHRLVVVGESGMLVFNDTVAGEEKLLRYSHAVGWDKRPISDAGICAIKHVLVEMDRSGSAIVGSAK